MDEEKEKGKENSTVDALVADIAADRDKYKKLYEDEKKAHAATLRKKLLGGGGTADDEEDEDDEDDPSKTAQRIKEKLFKKRR